MTTYWWVETWRQSQWLSPIICLNTHQTSWCRNRDLSDCHRWSLCSGQCESSHRCLRRNKHRPRQWWTPEGHRCLIRLIRVNRSSAATRWWFNYPCVIFFLFLLYLFIFIVLVFCCYLDMEELHSFFMFFWGMFCNSQKLLLLHSSYSQWNSWKCVQDSKYYHLFFHKKNNVMFWYLCVIVIVCQGKCWCYEALVLSVSDGLLWWSWLLLTHVYCATHGLIMQNLTHILQKQTKRKNISILWWSCKHMLSVWATLKNCNTKIPKIVLYQL